MKMQWKGVMPIITTSFRKDLSIDREFMAKHTYWLVDNGCTGIVVNGTLGEASTLSFDEKIQNIQTCVSAVGDRVSIVSGTGGINTAEAVAFAKRSEEVGCSGLMILPPYQYSPDWREMKTHLVAVIEATKLPCMLYNDPSSYQSDLLPEQIAELANEHSNVQTVKEATGDVRRITAIRALLGERLSPTVGLDSFLVEGIAAGAICWVAGLANALPKESVALYNYAVHGDYEKAFNLYRWFLILAGLNVGHKFVQTTKLIQESVGWGNTLVRPPRLELVGSELEEAHNIIKTALANRPKL
ncbi:dihydrodipicolinate synthase family protein [Microcoleus sp. B9-D4]|uniref:dihydrodipicolinate synthase family protein n=1 Tax=Microcoleus sp. B9-D4 TaxID=2818711 RepID=UPI002FCF822D